MSIPIPLGCTQPFGAPCTLLASPDVIVGMVYQNAFWGWGVTIPIPPNPALVGATVYCQGAATWVSGSPTSPIYLGFSAGLQVSIL